MNFYIYLNNHNLKKLTEEDLKALCELNNFKLYELKELNLGSNKLTDIDFIHENTSLVNLIKLNLNDTKITDLNNIRYLVNLEILNINYLDLYDEKETIELLKNMKKLKEIWCNYTFQNYNHTQLKKELPKIKINKLF